jgi:hypothetical protein
MNNQSQSQSTHVPLTLPCLIELDPETSLYTGHCLTFDLVSTAHTPDGAVENLRTLIKRHIEYSYTHHKAGLSVTADQDEWQRWCNMVNSGQVKRLAVEPIEVCLNEPWDSPTFWANVNFATGADSIDETAANNVCAPC